MAFRRQLGSLADLLLKSHLESNRQADENALVSQRQKDAASQAALNTLLEKGLGNPSLLDALASANPTLRLPGNIDPRVLLPNQAQVNQGIGQTIRSAKTEAEIPTVEDLVAGANPSYLHNPQPPDIADLMRQRTGKMEAINQATLDTEKPQEFQTVGKNAAGEDVQMGQFVKPSTMLGQPPVQTGLGSKPGEPQGITIDLPGVGTSLPATRIPATGKIMYAGRDVTTRPGSDQPWATVHEPALFTPVQSGAGYVNVSRRGGPAVPVLDTNKNPVGRGFTGATLGRMETAQQVEPHIQEVGALAKQLDDAGLFGPIMSRLRSLAVKAGSVQELADLASTDPTLQADPLAGQFATELPLLTSAIAMTHYGAGAGRSSATINMFKDMFSDAGTLDLFLGKLKGADAYISAYAKGPNGKGLIGITPPAPPSRKVLRYDINGDLIPEGK